MQRILEHIKVIKNMNERQINLEFISNCKIEDIDRCCEILKDKEIPSELYSSSKVISKELIKDSKFVDYLIRINDEKISLENLEILLSQIQSSSEKMSDYKLDNIIDTLKNKYLNYKTYYDYLKFFSDNIKKPEEKIVIAKNLEYFSHQSNVTISELDENERHLFILYAMSDYNLIPVNNIKKVCEFLVRDVELKNIILFLFDNNLRIPLDIEHYEFIMKSSKEIYKYLIDLSKMLDNKLMYPLLLRWIENDCHIYDLQMLEENLKNLDTSEIEKIFWNRSSYINYIFKSKLDKLLLENIDGIRENILIYAIHNNKKNFLKLIDANPQTFLDLKYSSIIFNKELYNKYININTLTIKNLIDLQSMNEYKIDDICLLKEGIYTFEEIKLLYNMPSIYIKFYNYLLDLKVDDRILIIRQLFKKDLLNKNLGDVELKKLAEKLKIKSLYNWLESDFSHIKLIEASNIIDILIKYDRISKFISQISSQKELLYVLRNIDQVQEYDSMEDIKNNIEAIDMYWKNLCSYMQLNDSFINENKNHIKNFLLNNGAELALSYFNNRNSIDKEAYKRIVKSELMGEFKMLKYYTDDLKKEINFNLYDQQVKEWTENNLRIIDGNIDVGEYDDFYSTMILGEEPSHTCLSYKNGMYNECLLACFDSNKKILYAKVNGKIVARAMIRLTKGTFSKCNSKSQDDFSFVDLENIKDKKKEQKKIEEYLTVFLERPYISGISSEMELKIKNMFVKLLENKAKRMNAQLVLSSEYEDIERKEFVTTKYYMYISKSKAGLQYLDSLNGQANVTDEGQYRMNRFMIFQQ